MATIEFWIQIENHAWDACPSGKDRMTGLDVAQLVGGKPPVNVTLHSPVTNHSRTVKMFQPVRDSDGDVTDALILRRYTPNWAAPDDRKVNPWDLNELDPTDNGTMGTIPGPVIECSVNDSVIVHFRNMDTRSRPLFKLAQAVTAKGMMAQMIGGGNIQTMGAMSGMAMGADVSASPAALAQLNQDVLQVQPGLGKLPFPLFVPLPILQRTHSLHTHGFVFAPTSDGAYPLTPPDPTQPVGAEAALWANVGVTGGFKQGDRVPPGATFTYSWNTIGWPTTQGVWLYHDHSVCDTENVGLGAIGIVVIHPPQGDPMLEQDVDLRQPNGALDPAFLPGGSPNGSPVHLQCFPLPLAAQSALLPHQFEHVGLRGLAAQAGGGHDMAMTASAAMPAMAMETRPEKGGRRTAAKKATRTRPKPEPEAKPPAEERLMHLGQVAFQIDDKLTRIIGLCLDFFRTPPSKALYLQLYHEFANMGMAVNGRKYLGNTPTVLAGPTTKMKFGVVGMGSMAHTFHIHGHRWLIPGPGEKGSQGLQFGSSMDTPTSQFEDTRVFGPANSFFFTINEGSSFMRALPPIGEWHMHCHVLAHMMDGMMGSLLIVNGGELAPPFAPLQVGQPCPTMPLNTPPPPPQPGTTNVQVVSNTFNPDPVTIKAGDTVHWVWGANNHSTTSDGGLWDSGVHNQPFTFDHTFNSPGSFGYHCTQHGSPGSGMHGTITVTP